MSADDPLGAPGNDGPPTPTRTLETTCTGPATVAVEIDAGRIEVRLAPLDDATTSQDVDPSGIVRAEVGVDEDAASRFVGVTSVLATIGQRWGRYLGAPEAADDDLADRALEAVTLDASDGALTVRRPREPALRSVPLRVTVWATDSSILRLKAGAAPIEVDGRCGSLHLTTSGDVRVEEIAGRGELTCHAGRITIGTAAALRVSAAAGDVDVGRVQGPTEITTAASTVRLGHVSADVAVRSAGGNVTVDEVAAGDLELSTGAGSIRVGVGSGVDAQVDLKALAGRASSELPVRRDPPDGRVPVRIRGRAAAGDARVVGV